MPHIVAAVVVTVVIKFGAKAAIWTSVQARKETFYDHSSSKLEIIEPGED
jgi:hypothetical protein